MLRREHHRAREEEEHFVGDCAAGLPRLLLCIIKYINTLRDILYFEVVALDLIMRRQEVEGMDTCTPCLEVVKQHIFSDVSIESLRVSEFLHPRFFDDGEDDLHSI